MSSHSPGIDDYTSLIIGQFGSSSWNSLSRDLQQLIDADQGRHWQHTLQVVAGLEMLLAGPLHPEWEHRYGLLCPEPGLMEWISRSKNQFDPDLLRVIALLHDLGKGVNLAGHEEISFRLLKQALDDKLSPTSNQALAATVIRHHADFGLLRSGQASEIILLTLLDDQRSYKLDGEKLLAALILLTLADWTSYSLLSASTMRRFLAYADFLRQDLETFSPPNPPEEGIILSSGGAYLKSIGSDSKLKQRLCQAAKQQTPERLNNLLLFTFSPQPVVAVQPLPERRIATTMAKVGLDWPDFQRKFALVRLDGAYAVFERCLALTPSFESYVTFMLQQLGRWLPSSAQVKLFEAGSISFTVNLRPIRQGLEQKSLDTIRAELAACELTSRQ